MVRTAFPDARYTVDAVLADGDLVSGRWTMTGTQTGPLPDFGLAPTGRPVRMHGMEIFRVRDGRLAELWHQESVFSMLAQLGAVPTPGP
jgi:predicted ester cyclase